MCGISAIWGDSEVSVIERMNNLMVHRGPDAHGVFVSPDHRTILGHRRLSIMDPQGGNQPIFNEDRSKAIIANGEIYNFPRLRNDLARGHRFSTTSDSEAILHQYEDSASGVVDHLDGMFSFVISDQDTFFAARDPIGIKPLYYGYLGKSMVFASELKAFPSNCRDINEFPPGTCFHSGQGFSTFYRVPNLKSRKGSVEEYCQQIRSTLEAAVEKRLMSDVPLGAFLSGGLDSSVIAALAKRSMGSLHTFSVGIEGSRDLEAARLVARHIGSIHHEYVITPQEVKQELPKIIYFLESFDQDLVRSAIP
ncbi:MAG: asparagine synthase-related protein, partial [Desulfobacteraceae bacterium]